MRERLTELALLHECQPAIALLDLRLHAEPERVGIGSDAALDQLQLAFFFGAANRHVVVGAQLALREIGRARLQRQQLGVLLGNELQHQAIEVRQLLPVTRGAPVGRVAIEDEALSRLELAQHEWTGADDLRWSRRRVPGLREGPGL